MAKEKTGPCKVTLVRGASFVTPGYQFKNGIPVTVADAKVLEIVKRSQQFNIEAAGAASADDGDSDVDEEPKPKKKKKR